MIVYGIFEGSNPKTPYRKTPICECEVDAVQYRVCFTPVTHQLEMPNRVPKAVS